LIRKAYRRVLNHDHSHDRCAFEYARKHLQVEGYSSDFLWQGQAGLFRDPEDDGWTFQKYIFHGVRIH
jgi:hypothetical protein